MIESVQIFKLLNFAVVIMLFAYLVRRYGIMQIMMMMRQERQERQDLKTQLKRLESDCDQVDKDMKLQERSYRLMKDKFQIWHRQVKQEDEQELQDFETRKKNIQQKRLQKLISLQKRMLIKKELPSVIKEVTQDLIKDFKNDEQQKKYTKQLVSLLEKSDV